MKKETDCSKCIWTDLYGNCCCPEKCLFISREEAYKAVVKARKDEKNKDSV